MQNQRFVGGVVGFKDRRVIVGDIGRIGLASGCPRCCQSWMKGQTVKEKHAQVNLEDRSASIGLPALCLYGVLLQTTWTATEPENRRHALVTVDLADTVIAHTFPFNTPYIRVLARKLKVLDFVDQLEVREPVKSLILAQPPEWHAYVDSLQPRTWREFFIQAIAPLGLELTHGQI